MGIVINEGFGTEEKVWAFTFNKPYAVVPMGENKDGVSHLETRLNKLKERDVPTYLGYVGSLMAQRYSNIKEIKEEVVLIKKFTNIINKEDISYDKEFKVHVIYFHSNENLMVLG